MNFLEYKTYYFIGIGGIGMSAIAKYLVSEKKEILGYDKTPSPITKSLQDLGIKISFVDEAYGLKELNKKEVLIIYTPAIPKHNKVYRFFLDNNFKVIKRSDFLGEVSKNTFCFAVAGTHGKTTTSSILTHILNENTINPTAFLGGIANNFHSNYLGGDGKTSVIEADEYDRSFLKLSPNISCITSMDADHLDIYGTHQNLIEAFEKFSKKITSEKLVHKKGLPLNGLTYSIESEADYTIQNLETFEGYYEFEIHTPKEKIEKVKFNYPGLYNVENALAASAMANIYGVSLEGIKRALGSFKGVQRRLSIHHLSEKMIYIDDYAHHPSEIQALLFSLKQMFPKRRFLGVFQPHLFSRTRDFVDGFAKSLEDLDELILMDIYPARELPIEGINSKFLLDKINLENKKISSKKDLLTTISKSNCDLIVTIGAGDIDRFVQPIKDMLNEV